MLLLYIDTSVIMFGCENKARFVFVSNSIDRPLFNWPAVVKGRMGGAVALNIYISSLFTRAYLSMTMLLFCSSFDKQNIFKKKYYCRNCLFEKKMIGLVPGPQDVAPESQRRFEMGRLVGTGSAFILLGEWCRPGIVY